MITVADAGAAGVSVCTTCEGVNRREARFCRFCGDSVPVGCTSPVEGPTSQTAERREWPGVFGQEGACSELQDMVERAELNRSLLGRREPFRVLLLGSTGTGKTTIARLMAQQLHAAGLVASPLCHRVAATALLADGVDLPDVLERARGGLLLIDDAHKLVSDRSQRITLLDTLTSLVEDEEHRVDPMIVVAGLPGALAYHLKEHPEVAQRFTRVVRLDEPKLEALTVMAVERLRAHYGLTTAESVRPRIEARLRQLRLEVNGEKRNGHLMDGVVAEIAHRALKRSQADNPSSEVAGDDIPEPVHRQRSQDEVLASFDDLVGMDGVRAFMTSTLNTARVADDEASESGVRFVFRDHLLLTGNPGTGKTTVARKLGEALAAAGLLESGHVVEVAGKGLIAEYVGQTAPRVHEFCDAATGGVLFVDEAYTMHEAKQGGGGFGQEAIDTLMKRMEDDRGKFVVIFAGYRQRIDALLRTNDGLPDRFTKRLHIDDYATPDLEEMFRRSAAAQGLEVDAEALPLIRSSIEQARPGPRFSNARFVRELFHKCNEARSGRVARSGTSDRVLRAEDVPGATRDPDAEFAAAMTELDALIGLEDVKQRLRDLAVMLRVQRKRAGAGYVPGPPPHMVLTGNPGTGKSTVARLFAGILHGLGVLQSARTIEVSLENLTGTHEGGTQAQVSEILEDAAGSVLFIDEAYRLVTSSYGRQAIDQLLMPMENKACSMSVVVAGYPREMKLFLDTNSGLRRRFDYSIDLPDYGPSERAQMFLAKARARGLGWVPEFEDALGAMFNVRGVEADGDYANAGGCEKLLRETLGRQALRVHQLPDGDTSHAELNTLRPSDLPQIAAHA